MKRKWLLQERIINWDNDFSTELIPLIDNCPIYFDDSGTGHQCINGHVIHVDCQNEWEKLNPEQRICPYCRGKFKMIEK